MSHDLGILALALAGGLPAIVGLVIVLATGDYAPRVLWTVGAVVIGAWVAAAVAVRGRVVRPLQTLANLLAALREGDYSIRARGADLDDPLGLAFAEVNALREPLRAQRLGALEAVALLQRVMSEIDVAVFAVDEGGVLRLANRAGERLLGRPAEQLVGRSADVLGLGACLTGEPRRVLDSAFITDGGRWELRRSSFRQGGVPMQLLVLTDLRQALREEERQAWQRLVRVLSHEINNSLAPIQSIAGSLRALLGRAPRPADADDDLARGLGVIGGRAESLSRFMRSYARMARLPAPALAPVDVGALVERVAQLEKRVPVRVRPGPPTTLSADGDQLEQLLINLVSNAVDASAETGGEVEIVWSRQDGALDLRVLDEGPGLPTTANLFTPFFTTKPSGTGIGLVLSRQIAEAHGGTLTLENRDHARGCVARLQLPSR
ncbi:MAG TPA: ATP-binding protein [Gemmatimonadaceae bacterium]|jgi:nitrogen fixation/metabolism regulation signal transduction histidine kinase|nr:ATP-binding protein [Gemmatimonadaceae bacterium]